MVYIPTPDEAYEILKKYNTEQFHLQHAKTVAMVLGGFALEYDPGREDYWRTVGLLHDIDFELYPDEHCIKARQLLEEEGIDEEVIRSVISHGYGVMSDVEPVHYMEKVLFAVDELTGLIGAVILMRPNGISDLETKSVIKKFRNKGFAAGCSREVISRGAQMLEMELDELITKTLTVMKNC